jgi:hypothetical protein
MNVNRTMNVNDYKIEEVCYQTRTSVYINDRLTEMTFEKAVEKCKKL